MASVKRDDEVCQRGWPEWVVLPVIYANKGVAISMEPTDYLETTTRITHDGVYFGDEKLPGLIADDGVSLQRGGPDGYNRLTVTFYVGHVEAVDPMSEQTDIEWPAREVTRYVRPVSNDGNP